jgi:hypothetical protein
MSRATTPLGWIFRTTSSELLFLFHRFTSDKKMLLFYPLKESNVDGYRVCRVQEDCNRIGYPGSPRKIKPCPLIVQLI